jgi:hypothetical protein
MPACKGAETHSIRFCSPVVPTTEGMASSFSFLLLKSVELVEALHNYDTTPSSSLRTEDIVNL